MEQKKKAYAGIDYESAVRLFADTVTRICAVRCGNLEDTKDCFQSVFLKLYTTDYNFVSEEHLKAWLIKVSITTSTDCVNQFWKKRVSLHDNDDISIMIKTLHTKNVVEDSYIVENENLVLEKVMRLPVKYSQVIYLFYYEGYKVNEISDILCQSEGTVKSQLCRGRKMLQKELEKCGIGGIADERII